MTTGEGALHFCGVFQIVHCRHALLTKLEGPSWST